MYWAVASLKNFISVSELAGASNLILQSPLEVCKSKRSTGVIPIPTFPVFFKDRTGVKVSSWPVASSLPTDISNPSSIFSWHAICQFEWDEPVVSKVISGDESSTKTFPTTCNLSSGVSVPIPTFVSLCIVIPPAVPPLPSACIFSKLAAPAPEPSCSIKKLLSPITDSENIIVLFCVVGAVVKNSKLPSWIVNFWDVEVPPIATLPLPLILNFSVTGISVPGAIAELWSAIFENWKVPSESNPIVP